MRRRDMLQSNNRWEWFAKAVAGELSGYLAKKVKGGYSPMSKDNQDTIAVVTLCGSDNKEDHVVTIAGKWIYDGNFDRALPRTEESLNWCCGSLAHRTTYKRTTAKSYHIVQRRPGSTNWLYGNKI